MIFRAWNIWGQSVHKSGNIQCLFVVSFHLHELFMVKFSEYEGNEKYCTGIPDVVLTDKNIEMVYLGKRFLIRFYSRK